MANVMGENTIKAHVVGNNMSINANIVSSSQNIKANTLPYSSATTEKKGIIRIATEEEAKEGADNTIAITPYTLNKLANTYTHEQAVASDIWVIKHNLNKYPSIYVVDSAGAVQIPNNIIIDNENQITVQFISAFAGKAYLN